MTLLEDSTASFHVPNGTLVERPRRGTLSHGQVPVSTSQKLHDSLLYTYTPVRDFSGYDSFSYTKDGKGDVVVVDVFVQPVNDDPLVKDDIATSYRGEAVSIQVLSNDEDVDNE